MSSVVCPRCLYPGAIAPGARFCPRCGLQDVVGASADNAPVDVRTPKHVYRVLDRIAYGDLANVYRCRFAMNGREVEGLVKIARDARTNQPLRNEARVLEQLHAGDRDRRFHAFLPAVEESFAYCQDAPSEARQANVLRMHVSIASVDELYTLEEVRRAYPAGVDPRDMAWIWRRLLSILGYSHAQGVIHGAVLPSHVVIEPREHKLLLIDWCNAVRSGETLHTIAGGYRPWYQSGAMRVGRPVTALLDVSMAARCMIDLVGGDAVNAGYPADFPAALRAYFGRCFNGSPDAWRMLDDFDRLIEALWGKRTFRVLDLPTKR
jgi:serine/threonine protein kinase